MIFLATPHRGSDLLNVLTRVIQTSSTNAGPRKILEDLAKRTGSLQALNESFRHVAPKLHLVSFFETKHTTVYGKTFVCKIDFCSSSSMLLLSPQSDNASG